MRNLSIRWRLTVAWAALFFAFGLVLLLTLNVFVGVALDTVVDEVRTELDAADGAPAPGLQPDGLTERLLGDPRAGSGVLADPIRDAAAAVRRATFITLAVLAVTAGGAGWWLSGRMLAPVRRLTQTARAISDDNLSTRIAAAGPHDELRELADAFDAMLERLERSFDVQRQFAADASHELRTPLTLIRAELDVTLADPDATPAERTDAVASLRHTLDHSEQLIDRLLQLASAGAIGKRTPVDLAELARASIEAHVADDGQLQVTRRLDPVRVLGDDTLLARLVDNLVHNAVRHNQPGGWLQVRTGVAADAAQLTIANSGPRLHRDEISQLTDRFYRPDPSRTRATGGSGLGLAIVAAIAQAHGGQLELAPTLGGGLTVDVRLPLAAPPDAP